MNKHHEQAIDGLDAAIFSGDLLHNHESRDALREALVRWLKAVHEEDVSERKERDRAMTHLRRNDKNLDAAARKFLKDQQT